MTSFIKISKQFKKTSIAKWQENWSFNPWVRSSILLKGYFFFIFKILKEIFFKIKVTEIL